jgi:hypothetical protein
MTEQEKLYYHDSETRKHVSEVGINIQKLIIELLLRASKHDASKFESPERKIYAEYTPLLGETVYGSPEYTELLKKVKVAIDHHYSKNRHHPEHWASGIQGMDLVDLMEMIADWMAATKRNKNGNIHHSIDVNTPRYDIAPQLAQILKNTVDRYF